MNLVLIAEPDEHLHREPGCGRRADVPLRRPLHAPPLLPQRVALRRRSLQDIPLIAGKKHIQGDPSAW